MDDDDDDVMVWLIHVRNFPMFGMGRRKKKRTKELNWLTTIIITASANRAVTAAAAAAVAGTDAAAIKCIGMFSFSPST